ncbi:MAG: IS66 family insertion sequence element accessory protein TnpA [Planctomycetota bacterium]|jgi:transposase-like protein
MAKRDPDRERRWRLRVEQWRESGQSAREFCQERGLSVNALYSWRRKLRQRDGELMSSGGKKRKAKRFVQLHVEPAPEPAPAFVEIELGDAAVMRLPTALDEAAMTRVISAARKAAAC